MSVASYYSIDVMVVILSLFSVNFASHENGKKFGKQLFSFCFCGTSLTTGFTCLCVIDNFRI